MDRSFVTTSGATKSGRPFHNSRPPEQDRAEFPQGKPADLVTHTKTKHDATRMGAGARLRGRSLMPAASGRGEWPLAALVRVSVRTLAAAERGMRADDYASPAYWAAWTVYQLWCAGQQKGETR